MVNNEENKQTKLCTEYKDIGLPHCDISNVILQKLHLTFKNVVFYLVLTYWTYSWYKELTETNTARGNIITKLLWMERLHF